MHPRHASAPGGNGGGAENLVGTGPVAPIVPATTPRSSTAGRCVSSASTTSSTTSTAGKITIPALNEMTDRAQWIALAYYQSGYERGFAAGYAAAERATWGEPVDWPTAVRTIKSIGLQPDQAQVREARGDHEGAEQVRDMWRTRGIA